MTHYSTTRILAIALSLGMASLAQAQDTTVSTVAGTQQTTTTTTTVVETGGSTSAAPKVISTKRCPMPTGSRMRPQRDANGRCPPESREGVEMDTTVGGYGNSTADLMRTQGN